MFILLGGFTLLRHPYSKWGKVFVKEKALGIFHKGDFSLPLPESGNFP
jgi:hypothetical protein